MTLFEHVVEQYPAEMKKRKYEYWLMLKRANEDYRSNTRHSTFQEEKQAFEQWMKDQWGVRVEVEINGYTPYYEIVDERKYMLFKLKYSQP